MFFDSLTNQMAWASLAFSVASLGAIAFLTIRSARTQGGSVSSDWLGCGLHALGMIYMSLAMLALVPSGYSLVLAGLFALCALFFAARTLFAKKGSRVSDASHTVGSVAMAYMFLDPSAWVMWLTIGFIAYYLCVVVAYTPKVFAGTTPETGRGPLPMRAVAHVAMACSMVLMFGAMQWPPQAHLPTDAICGPDKTPMMHEHHH